MIDPRIGNVMIDANALDRPGGERDALVERFLGLLAAGQLNVIVAGGVRDEVAHPGTPQHVKEVFGPGIVSLRPPLAHSQKLTRIRMRAILRGNAMTDKHEADASHLSEAVETGCAYFITHDKRILRKRHDLRSLLPTTFSIVTLERFLQTVDEYERGKPG